MLNKMTNQYSMAKTLKFKLNPIGKTEENVIKNYLDTDEQRAIDYKLIKPLIDQEHLKFINHVLEKVEIKDLDKYVQIFNKTNKTDADKKDLDKLEVSMRKAIIKLVTSESTYKSLFGKEMIKEILPKIYENDTEVLGSLSRFEKFTTYLSGFNENRKNMYSAEAKTTSIAYRIVNQNLPKYINNMSVYSQVSELIAEDIMKLEEELSLDVTGFFTIEGFNNVLTQNQIDVYNKVIGGDVINGVKVQGLNEYINLYKQKTNSKIPKLKMLYKQILSEKTTVSSIFDMIETDQEVLNKINEYMMTTEATFVELNRKLLYLNQFDLNGIFVKSGANITLLSNELLGSWDVFYELLKADYNAKQTEKSKKKREVYEVKRDKYISSIKSFSLQELQNLINESLLENKVEVTNYFAEKSQELYLDLNEAYENFKTIDANNYQEGKKLANTEDLTTIKTLLDTIKQCQYLFKMLIVDVESDKKNLEFYNEYEDLYEQVDLITGVYNKVRNYVTQKPYSQDKIKLNFNRPTLLNGWDKNKEQANLSVLLREKINGREFYYLAIMDPSFNKAFTDMKFDKTDECFEKMEYKYLPGPNKMLPKMFLSKKGVDAYNPPKELLEKYELKTHIKGDSFKLEDCHDLINYFKACLKEREDVQQFNFKFSPTASYENISDFYREVSNQGYRVSFVDVPKSYIYELVESGKLYLFEIYNKDFSRNKKAVGTDNLHTMYFKALFSEENLKNVVYKLNGEAEIFYRKASLKLTKPTHAANEPLVNKNKKTKNPTSTFEYDLYKDKRYGFNQFTLHVPIGLNFKAAGNVMLNDVVRQELKNSHNQHVIGIDRGERHLLYVSVVDSNGKIVEQKSFNIIENKKNVVDYHQLLESKEEERKKARQSWQSIEAIKELKQGYLSQVIHEICLLIEKYDALIVMEDLNMGFKNSRVKFERQVYQKFEKMLIDKLNYYVNKKKEVTEAGGLYQAYQLTNQFESFTKLGKQSGIIFYVPPYLTSKIDPVTGFVNLLDCRYKNMNQAKDFIKQLDDIRYNKIQDYFEVDINYANVGRGSQSLIQNWTLCTYGNRIENFRNKDKNNMWDSREINLTESFRELFKEYNITYGNIKEELLLVDKAEFYKSFMYLVKLTVQLRNSVSHTEIDYMISPIKNTDGKFYDSRNRYDTLPENADANGAYNIARKALWIIEQIKATEDVKKVKLSMTNKEWLAYAQKEFSK